MKILVIGVSGMLGNTVFRLLSESQGFETYGTARSERGLQHILGDTNGNLIAGVDVFHQDSVVAAFERSRPDVVVNCVGVVKQVSAASEPLVAIPLNAELPHRLAGLCGASGARLVHISTDCVFSGRKGLYVESDFPDADDVYGRTKFLGEVDYPHAITLRTSIIGHEINSSHSLIDWFLAQSGSIRGFRKAIFSGLPTVELARVIRDFVIPNPSLHGVYHVSAEPINKFELLSIVAEVYEKNIRIEPYDDFEIDRSLNSTRFRQATDYAPPSWPELVKVMHRFK